MKELIEVIGQLKEYEGPQIRNQKSPTRKEMIDWITETYNFTRPHFEQMGDEELKRYYDQHKSLEQRGLEKHQDLPKMRSMVSSDDGIYSIIAFEDGARLYTGEEDRCVLVRPRDVDKDVYSGDKYVDAVDEWENDYSIRERTMTKVELIHAIMVYEGVSRQDAEALVEGD